MNRLRRQVIRNQPKHISSDQSTPWERPSFQHEIVEYEVSQGTDNSPTVGGSERNHAPPQHTENSPTIRRSERNRGPQIAMVLMLIKARDKLKVRVYRFTKLPIFRYPIDNVTIYADSDTDQ